jgi:hypothetical protein
MKEFDLDKLERKTPYKVPENFFEEMQENVLKQTTKKRKKETKVFRLHFSAVLLLQHCSYFWIYFFMEN